MIKIAIIGVGNCASSLIQGTFFYKNTEEKPIGLMHKEIGGYKISDIKFVAAFDVDSRKVGKDLSEAIFSQPNCTKKLADVPNLDVIVKRGRVLDGVAEHMKASFIVNEAQKEAEVVKELINSGAEILVSYLPVGSAEATRFYAQCAIDAKIGFINAIPEFVTTDDKWIKKFEDAGVPCAGDDIKSQVGATIVHRVLAKLIDDRGQKIDNTYQLNFGGNTDFQNMLDQTRLVSKRKSKTRAVTAQVEYPFDVKIGPSDFVPYQKDNKICYINIKGRQFGNVPFEIELKLSVEDSPNSAGVMVDVIRCMKLALDNNISGYLKEISAYSFKSPKCQLRDDEGMREVDNFINRLT